MQTIDLCDGVGNLTIKSLDSVCFLVDKVVLSKFSGFWKTAISSLAKDEFIIEINDKSENIQWVLNYIYTYAFSKQTDKLLPITPEIYKEQFA